MAPLPVVATYAFPAICAIQANFAWRMSDFGNGRCLDQ
jgi:hypothetical protein